MISWSHCFRNCGKTTYHGQSVWWSSTVHLIARKKKKEGRWESHGPHGSHAYYHPKTSSRFHLLFCLLVCLFETGSPIQPGWSQTCCPSAWTSQVLGLNVCATTPAAKPHLSFYYYYYSLLIVWGESLRYFWIWSHCTFVSFTPSSLSFPLFKTITNDFIILFYISLCSTSTIFTLLYPPPFPLPLPHVPNPSEDLFYNSVHF